MAKRRRPQISSRKQPQQARSTELVAAILQAAVQVLAKHGVARFTSARVAAAAGVSVGSVYQYFPNKVAILFRLQSDEWAQTTALLRDLLEDRRQPPLARLRRVVHAFLRTECEEAAMRAALDDAAPLYRDAPEAKAVDAAIDRMFATFIAEAVPGAPPATRALASELVQATLFEVGAQVSEGRRTAAQITAYGDALADMLCAYLNGLG
jgi:AcrR family transcriptional regulator